MDFSHSITLKIPSMMMPLFELRNRKQLDLGYKTSQGRKEFNGTWVVQCWSFTWQTLVFPFLSKWDPVCLQGSWISKNSSKHCNILLRHVMKKFVIVVEVCHLGRMFSAVSSAPQACMLIAATGTVIIFVLMGGEVTESQFYIWGLGHFSEHTSWSQRPLHWDHHPGKEKEPDE